MTTRTNQAHRVRGRRELALHHLERAVRTAEGEDKERMKREIAVLEERINRSAP